MKNGRKQIVPTPRQLEKMELLKNKQAVAPYADDTGYTAPKYETNLVMQVQLKRYWETFTDKRRKEILEKMEATEEYINLRAYELLLLAKKGIYKDDRNDPKFRLNIEKIRENWSVNSDIELCAMFDRHNRFIGFNTGKEHEVDTLYIKGSLVGGTTIHNHPTTPDRPLGLSFSRDDLNSFLHEGTRRFEATAREGTYAMTTKGAVRFKQKDFDKLFDDWNDHKAAIAQAFQARGLSTSSDMYWRIRCIDHHKIMEGFAKEHGFTYKFTPRKKYEKLMDISQVDKPLPKFK